MHASDSIEQRKAEVYAIQALSRIVNAALLPKTIRFGRSELQLDGCDDSCRIAAEVYCGIETPWAGQIKKVIADGFKLIAFERFLERPVEKQLCFIHEITHTFFVTGHWYFDAFAALGIQMTLVELPKEIKEAVRAANCRQGKTFRSR